MVTHLYKSFLESEQVYKSNIEFWKTIIYTLLSVENITFNSYLDTTKKDGSLYMEGNPIFNFRIENSNRAVRIIQEEIETGEVEFSAWMNSLTLSSDETIDELVISLELSNESALLAIELINAWIVNRFSKKKMEKYVDKLFTLKETIFQANNRVQVEVGV